MNLEDQLQALIDSSPPHIQRHFACDCAERALKAAKVKDERSWAAVEVGSRYAEGAATSEELDAARDAAESAARSAWSAAWAAAWSAARAAAWSAARDAARSAEWAAARDAARSAAGSAARSAARDAARSAAWAAARDAAESAARSAGSAAWSAAGSAAAREEERKWQIEHLKSLIAAHNAARSSLLHILQQRAEALRPTFTQYARTLEERAFE